eukprot:scaffold24452_cov61-Phaeocystis_antarctica.AAC.6
MLVELVRPRPQALLRDGPLAALGERRSEIHLQGRAALTRLKLGDLWRVVLWKEVPGAGALTVEVDAQFLLLGREPPGLLGAPPPPGRPEPRTEAASFEPRPAGELRASFQFGQLVVK